jgi:hypothetical protein
MAIMDSISDTVVISDDVKGASYEELNDAQDHFYYACGAKPLCLLSCYTTRL